MEPMITITSASRWNSRRNGNFSVFYMVVLVLGAKNSTDTAKCSDFIPQTLCDHVIRCLSSSECVYSPTIFAFQIDIFANEHDVFSV